MGWYYSDSSRKNLIEELTRGKVTNDTVIECLKKCYKGNPGVGVLWSVWQAKKSSGIIVDKWIGCDIMHYRSGQWGHKPLEESMHPYCYSCPLLYLDMVPLGQYAGCNPEWRKIVIDRANRKKAQRKQLAGR